MTLAEYMNLMRCQAIAHQDSGAVAQADPPHAALLNWRFLRIYQSFTVSSELNRAVAAIQYPQAWMVITEPWCGDSSQLLPIIARIAACNLLIRLDFVLRDEHPEIMDAYLTNGKRSIPKVVASNRNGEEIFRWGPRPRAAQKLFESALKEGTSTHEAVRRLHLFYAKDKGRATDMEFLELLGGCGID